MSTIKRWAETTTIHGPAHVVHDGSSVMWHVIWFVLTLCGLIGALSLSWNQFAMYHEGRVTSDVSHAIMEPLLSFCSDDWIDPEKVKAADIGVHEFAYFLSLLPGIYNKYDMALTDDTAMDRVGNIIHRFYDEFDIDQSDRIRVDRAYYNSTLNDILIDSKYGDALDVDDLAANVAEFAENNQLNDLLSFALHFAREDVTLRGTEVLGYSLHFGRLCRELQPAPAPDNSFYNVNDELWNFYVKYDFSYGWRSQSTTKSNSEFQQLHRVGILPYTGMKKQQTYVTQQRLFAAIEEQLQSDSSGQTPEPPGLIQPLPEMSSLYSYSLSNEADDPGVHSLESMFANNVVSLRYAQEFEIISRVNAGQSLCEPRGVDSQLPEEYEVWECTDKCQETASEAFLESECDFIGSTASLYNSNPCSCLRREVLKTSPSLVDFGMCGEVDEECVQKCRDERLTPCNTYATKLRLTSKARFVSRQVHAREYPGEYQQGNTTAMIHIQVDARKVTVYTERLAVTQQDLIVGLGGTTGFFMGLSVLSLVHALIWLCRGIASVIGGNRASK